MGWRGGAPEKWSPWVCLLELVGKVESRGESKKIGCTVY